MMLNDGRICFIVIPDINIMVCCSKYNFSDFMATIFEFYVLQKIHNDESPTSAQISP